MKPTPRWLSALAVAFAIAVPLASAHPGHDGGHELTWDFGHLAAHPAATVLCVGVLIGAAILAARAVSFCSAKLRDLRR